MAEGEPVNRERPIVYRDVDDADGEFSKYDKIEAEALEERLAESRRALQKRLGGQEK